MDGGFDGCGVPSFMSAKLNADKTSIGFLTVHIQSPSWSHRHLERSPIQLMSLESLSFCHAYGDNVTVIRQRLTAYDS